MTTRQPLLSIVIPTYNQGPYIEKCLTSIAEQSYRDIEVLIQDNYSTDDTEKICRAFATKDSRFYYCLEKDRGQSDAINKGLVRSNGDFWTWICSDDFYVDNQAIEKLIAALRLRADRDRMCVGVYGDAANYDHTGNYVDAYLNHKRDLVCEDFKLSWPLAQPASLWVRHRVMDVGGLDSNLHLGMDLDLFIRLLRDGHYMTYYPCTVAGIRAQPQSKSVKYRVATAQNALRIVKHYFPGRHDPIKSIYFQELRGALIAQAPNKFVERVDVLYAKIRPAMRHLYTFPLFSWIPRLATPIKKGLLKVFAVLDERRFAWRQRRS